MAAVNKVVLVYHASTAVTALPSSGLELLDRVRAAAEHNSLFTLSRYQTLIMTRLPFNINNIASPARFVTRRHKQTMHAQQTRRKLPKTNNDNQLFATTQD